MIRLGEPETYFTATSKLWPLQWHLVLGFISQLRLVLSFVEDIVNTLHLLSLWSDG
jgi:hypothetical protein